MGNLLRRLRGIIGTGLTWAVGWTTVTLGLVVALRGLPLSHLGDLVLSLLAQGFIAGGAFAIVLSVAERHCTIEDLSFKRVALWGAIGGMAVILPSLPFLLSVGIPWFMFSQVLVINGLIGAGLATGSVTLARRGDAKLLEGEGTPGLIERD